MCRKQLLLLAILSIAVPSLAENMLTNGDFNTGDFTGWYTYVENTENCWVQMETDYRPSYDRTPFAAVWCLYEAGPGGVAGQVIDLGAPGSIPSLDFSCVANRSEWEAWGDAIGEMYYYEPNDSWLS